MPANAIVQLPCQLCNKPLVAAAAAAAAAAAVVVPYTEDAVQTATLTSEYTKPFKEMTLRLLSHFSYVICVLSHGQDYMIDKKGKRHLRQVSCPAVVAEPSIESGELPQGLFRRGFFLRLGLIVIF